MDLDELEKLMAKKGYVDTMGGYLHKDRTLREIDGQLEMDFGYRQAKNMLIFLEPNKDGYTIRTYIPVADFKGENKEVNTKDGW